MSTIMDEENFRFQAKKAKIMWETTRFWQNISSNVFKCSPFLYIMKACQFKIYKCFDKEREQTLIQQSMRKEKLRKVGLCFITGTIL